jgi:integrase
MPPRKLLGSWFVDFRFGKQRVRKKSPVDTKQSAIEYERLLRERLLKGLPIDGEPPPAPDAGETVAQFLERWVEVYIVNNKPSEAESKRSIVKNHLNPFFGDEPIAKVNWLRRIAEFKAHQVRVKKLHPKTVNNQLTCLRRALVIANEWGLLPHVPVIHWMKAPAAEFDFLTTEESDRLLAAASQKAPMGRPVAIGHTQGFVMVAVALKAGLRRGELLALRWEDVDFGAQKINVRLNDSRGHLVTPKGGRSREVPLSPILAAILQGHRHLRGAFVFCDHEGGRLTRDAIKHVVPGACARAGLRAVQWHVLRHSFASQLVMAGVPLKVVQELLGHATIEMTMRYAHLAPSMHVDAVKRLDDASTLGAYPELYPKVGQRVVPIKKR